MNKHMEFVGLIKELVSLYQVETYVEIGVEQGRTFNQISPLVKRAVGVDKVMPTKLIMYPNVELFHMTSAQFALEWKDPIDLLFIDADHGAVLSDFDALSPFVRKGCGLILLHDTYPTQEYMIDPYYCDNAWEAARAIHKDYPDWEIVTLPGPHAGLSICRWAGKHFHWREENVQSGSRENIPAATGERDESNENGAGADQGPGCGETLGGALPGLSGTDDIDPAAGRSDEKRDRGDRKKRVKGGGLFGKGKEA